TSAPPATNSHCSPVTRPDRRRARLSTATSRCSRSAIGVASVGVTVDISGPPVGSGALMRAGGCGGATEERGKTGSEDGAGDGGQGEQQEPPATDAAGRVGRRQAPVAEALSSVPEHARRGDAASRCRQLE